MRILVIGGTKFVGYHMVAEAVARGHEVVLFNRGISGAGAFPQLVQVHGDRGADLGLLDGMSFDAVIDSSCYLQGHMQAAAQYFAGRVGWYVLVSTLSVHDTARPGARESDPLPEVAMEGPPEALWEHYGAYKAGCEAIARQAFGDALTILRPSFVCGSRDHTDRMSYWPVKLFFQPAVLCPQGDFPFQYIDARDLADFCLHTLENRIPGPFIVAGPRDGLTFGGFLQAATEAASATRAASATGAAGPGRLVPVAAEVLAAHGIAGPEAVATAFPLWLDGLPGAEGMFLADSSRALAAGLSLRPLADTVEAALRGFLSRETGPEGLRAGLPAGQERDILAALGL